MSQFNPLHPEPLELVDAYIPTDVRHRPESGAFLEDEIDHNSMLDRPLWKPKSYLAAKMPITRRGLSLEFQRISVNLAAIQEGANPLVI